MEGRCSCCTHTERLIKNPLPSPSSKVLPNPYNQLCLGDNSLCERDMLPPQRFGAPLWSPI